MNQKHGGGVHNARRLLPHPAQTGADIYLRQRALLALRIGFQAIARAIEKAQQGFRNEARARRMHEPITQAPLATGIEAVWNLHIVQADLEDGSPWPLPGQRFGAVVVTNYLWRPLLPLLVAALEEHGILLYETFAVGDEAYRRPARPEFLLRQGELIEAVQGRLQIVAYEHGRIARPRAGTSNVCAASTVQSPSPCSSIDRSGRATVRVRLAFKLFEFEGVALVNLPSDGSVSLCGAYHVRRCPTFPQRRFAGGGLLPDEVPIIARRGELVVPPQRIVRGETTTREAAPVTVVINVTAADANLFRASQGQITAEMARAIDRAGRNR